MFVNMIKVFVAMILLGVVTCTRTYAQESSSASQTLQFSVQRSFAFTQNETSLTSAAKKITVALPIPVQGVRTEAIHLDVRFHPHEMHGAGPTTSPSVLTITD